MTRDEQPASAKNWFRYKIDYQYGIAELWSKDRLVEPLERFETLANECFGIRKSIGDTRLLAEELLPLGETITTPKTTDDNIRQATGDFAGALLLQLINRQHTKSVPAEKLAEARFILAHSGGDVIVFGKRNKKLISEFD